MGGAVGIILGIGRADTKVSRAGLRRAAPLCAVVAVALLLRLAVVVATPDYRPTGDPADYDRIAVSLSWSGRFPPTEIAGPGTASAYRPPAYPLVLATAYKVTGKRYTAGRLVGVGLGVLAVVLIYLCVSALAERRVALLASGIGALVPTSVWLNATLLSESLFIPVGLALLCATLRHRRDKRLRWAAAAGILLGVATLTRANGVVLALPMIIGLRGGRGAVVACVAAAVVLAPWTLRNEHQFHRFLPLGTQSGYSMAGAWNSVSARPGAFHGVWQVPSVVPGLHALFGRPGLDEGELDARLRADAVRFAKRHRSYVVSSAASNFLRFFNLGPAHSFVTDNADAEMGMPDSQRSLVGTEMYLFDLLAAGGLIVLWFRSRRTFLWLTGVALVLIGSTVLWNGSPRYATPVSTLLVLPAAYAVIGVGARAARRNGSRTDARQPAVHAHDPRTPPARR